MENKDLLKRLLFIKKNPKLADIIPQAEILSYIQQLLNAYQALETAIKNGRLKGEPGQDGYSPVNELNAALRGFESRFTTLLGTVEKRLATITNGTPGKAGKDAEITDDIKREIAEIARSLIELPDFDALISQTITANPEAIRNSLELLVGGERYHVEINDVQGLRSILDDLAVLRSSGGGGIGRNQVDKFIADSDTWKTGGTSQRLTVSATEPPEPRLNDLWAW